jgi:hypothetical protein
MSSPSNIRLPRVTATHSRLASAGLPYFFAWPVARPLERAIRIRCRRVRFRTKLDQVLDLESGDSQQSDPITVGEMKLNAVVRGPFNTCRMPAAAVDHPRRCRLRPAHTALAGKHEQGSAVCRPVLVAVPPRAPTYRGRPKDKRHIL